LSAPLDAFRFLSAVPLPERREEGGRGLRDSIAFFPLVGAVLGGLLVLTDWVCGHAFPENPRLVSAALVLAVYALFTGALHHDGLMDAADAFWGRHPGEDRLRIMKDSRVGAMGVTALALVLLAELACLYSVPVHAAGSPGTFRWAVLLSFPIIGRWVMSYLCFRFPYARRSGTAAAFALPGPGAFALSTLVAVAGLFGAFVFMFREPLLIVVLLVVPLAFGEMMGALSTRSLGGVTGDVIGAVGFLSELLVLLILASRLPETLSGM
jgi:adenosylcobinamide-GDP ribazoletransferase